MAAIDRLAEQPRPPGCVKLSGRDDQWRIRAGDYRIVYEIHAAALLVLVVDAGTGDRSTAERGHRSGPRPG